MYRLALALLLLFAGSAALAQDKEEAPGGFRKDKLFTGGSISLGLGNNTFQVGASPVFGYSIARWLDAGIIANYNYTSYRDVVAFNDKLRYTTYGGGAFTRIYPIRFLFAHVQFEHNFIKQKYIPRDAANETHNVDANSLLLGAGIATERYPDDGRPFFYLSILFDVLDNDNSPYVRSDGSLLPILRAGIQVPLFQGSKPRY
ncbi:MAG: hypothetical protein JNK79_04605 [Chitinophagaceae bacterium]|nr:hypothetical protein [Chitinophagaceae bacterium]